MSLLQERYVYKYKQITKICWIWLTKASTMYWTYIFHGDVGLMLVIFGNTYTTTV